MTDNTMPPPTSEQSLAARAEMTEIQTRLAEKDEAGRYRIPDGTPTNAELTNRLLTLMETAYAAAPPPAGIVERLAERRTHRQSVGELRAELERTTPGTTEHSE